MKRVHVKVIVVDPCLSTTGPREESVKLWKESLLEDLVVVKTSLVGTQGYVRNKRDFSSQIFKNYVSPTYNISSLRF